MNITQNDLKKYQEAQKLKTIKCPITKTNLKQTKYGIYRYKASGLPLEKYLYIADNEEELLNEKQSSRFE